MTAPLPCDCPLGDDCDLTVAWMAGHATGRASARAHFARLVEQMADTASTPEAAHHARQIAEAIRGAAT